MLLFFPKVVLIVFVSLFELLLLMSLSLLFVWHCPPQSVFGEYQQEQKEQTKLFFFGRIMPTRPTTRYFVVEGRR